MIAMELEDILADLGHRVIEVAVCVDEALRAIDRSQGEIDAVLLDANLDGESAIPVAARLREARIPFVIASGYERSELDRSGFDGPRLGKPYSPAEIDQALGALLQP